MLKSVLLAAGLLIAFLPDEGNDSVKDKKMNIDSERARKVPVVLRVKLDRYLGGESGAYSHQVKVLDVLKNDSRQKFAGPLPVGVRVKGKFGPGNSKPPAFPKQECTVYLVPVGDTGAWQVLDGGPPEGVSHVSRAEK